MSKIGFHISAGNMRGLGDALLSCAQAGNPVPVVFSVDQNIWPDIKRFSPLTTYIFRTQKDYQGNTIGDGPGDTYIGNAEQSARDWMNKIMPVWVRNPAHYYAPINEQDPATLDGFSWLNDFTLECERIAAANGYKLALYAFSGGNPKEVDQPAVGQPFTRYGAWDRLVPSLQAAKAGGHILLLHEYGFDSPTMRVSHPYRALRYRSAARFLLQRQALPKIVISEASAGVGFDPYFPPDIWLNDLAWYDAELMRDDCVIGACAYQLGGDENFVNVLYQLAAHIRTTPTKQAYVSVVPGPDVDYAGNPVPSSMPPSSEPPTKLMTVVAAVLNVRRSPSTTAPVAYTLTRGQTVKVATELVSGSYRWAKLSDGNYAAISRTVVETYLA